MHFKEIQNAQEATVARKTEGNFEQDQAHVGCDAADVKTIPIGHYTYTGELMVRKVQELCL